MKKLLISFLCIITAVMLGACSPLGLHIGSWAFFETIKGSFRPSNPPDAPYEFHFETSIPEAQEVDKEAFLSDCEKMQALFESGDTAASFKMYDDLYDKLLKIMDAADIAFIRFSDDVNNEELASAEQEASKTLNTAADRFSGVCHEMISGKNAESFRDFLEDDALIEYFEDYNAMSEEEIELLDREKVLIQKSSSLFSDMTSISCEIDEKTYTLDDVVGENAMDFYVQHADIYEEVLTECQKALNDKTGEIFMELLPIRDQIAKLRGYDNYADYCDTETYGRTYSEEDLEQMKSEVRAVAPDFSDYSYLVYTEVPFDMDTDSLLFTGKRIADKISPYASDALSYLTENGLASISSESGRESGAYTTYMAYSKMPFIFEATNKNADDMITLFHELGHFTAFYNAPSPYPPFFEGDLDLMETHSQGLQLLFNEYSDEVFGDDAVSVNCANLAGVANVIIEGCVLDDWQREVYKNPDMSLDEINELYKNISKDYGEDEYPGMEYGWCQYPHNFSAPMYYISYAISAFSALEIWSESQDDYEGAVKTWEKLIDTGAFKDDYRTVIKNAGLETFDERGSVSDIFDDVIDYLKRKNNLWF